MRRRIAMAGDAPLHVERVLAPHERHLVHAPVTRLAADALLHVRRVIEVGEVGQVVNAQPLDRSIGAVALADRLEDGCVLPHLRVARHAGLGGGEPREARVLDARVAVATVDAEPLDVVLVAERHRLHARGVLLRDVGGTTQSIEQPPRRDHDEDGAENRDTADRVRAAMKDLGHRFASRRAFSAPPAQRRRTIEYGRPPCK